VDIITPLATRIRLFINGRLKYSIASIILAIVGCKGGLTGVVRITSFELFKAVTIQPHNGSKVTITNIINKT